MKKFLGIDIGGTNLRGAVLTEEGKILQSHKTSSGAKKGINQLITNLDSFIHNFVDFKPDGIGIGIPGIIDRDTGLITQAPNIKNAENFPIKNTLSELTEIPVEIENDANCAALGEYWQGAGIDTDSMVMITIGTGLGGGLIIRGELWSGYKGMGGEIGHMTIDPDGPVCNCGNNGCVESYVSAEALRRIVKEHRSLEEYFKNTRKENVPERLMQLAESGNKDAVKIWEEFGTNLGIGIANLANLLNMEVLVIGGGLSNAWDLFIGPASRETVKRGLVGPVNTLTVKKAELGDEAGIIGAAYLALNFNL